jgi:hypothetical protein
MEENIKRIEEKSHTEIKRIFIILIATLLFVILIFYGYQKITSNAIKEQEKLHSWLIDNCNCTEKSHIICPSGYEYKEGYCKSGEFFTLISKGCSKYDCSGTLYILNEEEKWQKEN